MGMGRRERDRQEALFVTAQQLPESQGHEFYRRLNGLLSEAGFDRGVEKLCEPYYQPPGHAWAAVGSAGATSAC